MSEVEYKKITNMNVFTFIKEIYASLKNINVKLKKFEENIENRINTLDNNISVLQNRIPQRELHAVVVPDYVTLNYSFIIWTDFVAQNNKIVEAINYASDTYWGDPDRYKFRVSINSIQTPTELVQDSLRSVKANFNLTLYGQIAPEVPQKDLSAINKYFDKTKAIFSTEIVSKLPK